MLKMQVISVKTQF